MTGGEPRACLDLGRHQAFTKSSISFVFAGIPVPFSEHVAPTGGVHSVVGRGPQLALRLPQDRFCICNERAKQGCQARQKHIRKELVKEIRAVKQVSAKRFDRYSLVRDFHERATCKFSVIQYSSLRQG